MISTDSCNAEVEQRAGRVANFTGDGHLAVFDRAEDALFTALRISHGVHALGVEVRMGTAHRRRDAAKFR